MGELINANPIIYNTTNDSFFYDNFNEEEVEAFDEDEIWQLIRNINDPEHPVNYVESLIK